MSRNILYTYSNLNEFNQLFEDLQQQDKEVIPFFFQETKDLLGDESGLTIDISLLVEYIEINKNDRYAALNNLRYLDDGNRVVVQKELAEKALIQFPFVFSKIQPLYFPKLVTEVDVNLAHIFRRTIYSYRNPAQLERIIEFTKQQSIPFFSFSQASKKANSSFSELDKSKIPPIVDITTMINAALSNNAQILFLAEQFIDSLTKGSQQNFGRFATPLIPEPSNAAV